MSNSSPCSSNFTQRVEHHPLNSMSKLERSLHSSALKSDLGVIHTHQQTHPLFKAPHLQTTYMNSKRKRTKYSDIYSKIYPDNNYLHLNSLWSIWYGVSLTLFQGYLAVHGASRFLGCSLIPWKIEPVAELNLQIVLSGLVFVLLPFFFASAVFKVGNMANDGVKLGSASKDRICFKMAEYGFREESHNSSMKTLWVHGGPTAAFIHILIALCLLLPRLLLEGRIIENGFLPRETIWQTELDFMVVNRNNLLVLSIKSSQNQNNTLIESVEYENSLNNNKIGLHTYIHQNLTNLLHSNLRQKKTAMLMTNGKQKYIEAAVALNGSNIFLVSEKSTVSPIVTSNFAFKFDEIDTTNGDNKKISMYEDIGAVTIANIFFSSSTQKYRRTAEKDNKLMSFPAHFVSYNTYHNKQHIRQNHHNDKVIRKYNRQRKPFQQYHSYGKNSKLKNQKNLNFDLTDIDNQKNINLYNKSQSYNENKANKVINPDQTLATYLKSNTTNSTTGRDSNIHIVKPEKLPEIMSSRPVSSNSKIIEIKQKTKRAISPKEANFEQIYAELLSNDSSEYVTSTMQSTLSNYNFAQLDGFAGVLQVIFGVKKQIDLTTFNSPPSAEFLNLLFGLLVWCVRYPSVFWTTAKSFATVFSVQMIVSAVDIIFSYVGISSLLKLQIYNQGQQIQNQSLVLNATVTLALFLLSVVLILSSSMVLYLFGYGRLSARMRDRSTITLSSNKSWIYFAHCSSLCYILALCVVKAPLLNDLSATYHISWHFPTFVSGLISIMHILLWIVIWMILTVKSKWSFKLPPLNGYVPEKAVLKPLLVHNNRKRLTNTTVGIFSNSTNLDIGSSAAIENAEIKVQSGNTDSLFSNTSGSDMLNCAPKEEIYWPTAAPSSPKLKVTFKEVSSTSEDAHHHRHFGEHDQSNGKCNSYSGSSVREIDDGEYATLRPDQPNMLGNISSSGCETKNNTSFYKNYTSSDSVNCIDLRECDDLPPHPPNITSSMTMINHITTVSINHKNTQNFLDDCVAKILEDDNISHVGNIIEHVLDDRVTYASTKDLEPALPLPFTSSKTEHFTDNIGPITIKEKCNQISECSQLSSYPEYLSSDLTSPKVNLHANEAHIFHNATPRCLRSADSGVSHEVLTPRSDTNSFGTECTISPPERPPSESSSGIHSAEEREIDIVIRPRHIKNKNASKLPPPAIQEEPNNRCTNIRMSSFAVGNSLNNATLPSQRSTADEKFDYFQHCSTMPLPTIIHNQRDQQIQPAIYATSAQCMSKTKSTFSNVSSFKPPLYVNSGYAISADKQRLYDQNICTLTIIPPQSQLSHTILSNGVRYSNPNILRRYPFLKVSDPQNSFTNSTIHEDRDSANYSMISDQENIYATTNSLG